MRKLRGFAIAGTLMLGWTIGATGASAATEVGNDCEANSLGPDNTLLPLVNGPAGSLPVTVPSAGVATHWKVQYAPSTNSYPEKLKVLRPTESPHRFLVVAESSTRIVAAGQNVFAVRIPVRAGDRFAVYGIAGTLSCKPASPGDLLGTFSGDASPGSQRTVNEETSSQAAISALVEPDGDGDGYGDETQDKCPQSAIYQGECPTVKLTTNAKVRTRSILLRVTASSQALVRVTGQVGWGYKANPGLKTAGSKPTRLIVGLRGGTKTVVGGKPAAFRVQLPKAVLRRLGRISPQESLKAKIAISATESAGPVAIRRLTVKLKGRGG